jgi:hypothetical protein
VVIARWKDVWQDRMPDTICVPTFHSEIASVFCIEEEGQYDRCVKCGVFQKDVGPRHQTSAKCITLTLARGRREDVKMHS